MRRVLRWTDALLLRTASLFMAGFLTTVVLQVFFRYVLEYSLPWTEELGVYLFVWSAFMAASVVVGMNDHFSISLVAEWLGLRQQAMLNVVITLLCLSFTSIMVWQGTTWSWRMLATFSPVLQLPQGAVYAIVPLSGVYMALHLALRLMTLGRRYPGTDRAGGAVMLTATLFGTMLLLFALSVPIAFGVGLAGAAALLVMPKVSFEVIVQRMFHGLDSFLILSVPLFLLFGELMESAKITDRLVNFTLTLIGRLRGGLGHVTVATECVLSGVTGSGAGDAAALGSVLVPAMVNAGYKTPYAAALVGAASVLGPIIPPASSWSCMHRSPTSRWAGCSWEDSGRGSSRRPS